MLKFSAAKVGESIDQIDTPALIMDLDAFEKNNALLFASLTPHGVRIRPHAKSHKCPEISKCQIALGAVGVCCQKVSEAQAFADAGIADILIANEVVGEKKIAALVALAKQVTITVCVDHAENAKALNAAAMAAGITLNVLIEIDVGAKRCGVAPGEPALALAKAIQGLPALTLKGLQAYHGPAQHFRTQAERTAAIQSAAETARTTRDLLNANGIACEIITGAGTGSYLLEAASGVFNEVQPGSYIFMDADYARNDWASNDMPKFEHSLFVLASVMSASRPGHAVVDAGLKASSVDSGMPTVFDRPGVTYLKASDEHGVLAIDANAKPVTLGEKIKLVPGHCDPTVNLYDELILVRKGKVEAIWPIAARGAVL
jgi:D-serine deaminase-like pyridoxal phosphate-dependent protein